MQTYEVRLIPRGLLQSFSAQPSLPTSLTLFGAICWGIRAIWGKEVLKKLLTDFLSSPHLFFVSSAFPLLHVENGFSVRFFPKPKGKGLTLDEAIAVVSRNGTQEGSLFSAASKHKRFRKFAHVSERLFLDVLSGTQEFKLFGDWMQRVVVEIEGLLLTRKEYDNLTEGKELVLSRSLPQARNAIDRLMCSTSGGGEFFYDFRLSCPPNTAAFFLLKAGDVDFLRPVFRYLEDTGIGGERSIGMNRFRIELNEAKLDFPGESRKLATLSRWRVDPAELDMNRKDEFCYELLPLRQKIETGYDFKDKGLVWKRKALYFLEGSVLFVKEERQHYGELWHAATVAGETIVDYGIAFPAFFTEESA